MKFSLETIPLFTSSTETSTVLFILTLQYNRTNPCAQVIPTGNRALSKKTQVKLITLAPFHKVV